MLFRTCLFLSGQLTSLAVTRSLLKLYPDREDGGRATRPYWNSYCTSQKVRVPESTSSRQVRLLQWLWK